MIDSMNSIAPAPTPGSSSPKPQAAHAPAAPDPNTVRLFRMKQECKDMLNKFSARYPDVIQCKQDVEALERQVQDAARDRQAAEAAAAEAKRQSAAAEAAAVKPKEDKPAPRDPYVVQMEEALSQLAVEITALKEEEAKLRGDMATYQQRVDNTPRRDLEFQELSRDYGSTRELYNTLLKRYEEAQLSENLEQRQKGEQFRILEAGVTPTVPAAPNRLRFLVLSLGLSVAIAVGLATFVSATREVCAAHLPDWAKEIAKSAPPLPEAVPKETSRVLFKETRVEVEKDGHRVCGTSIMGLMMLGAAMGDNIVIHVEGDGAGAALEQLVALVEERFGEE